MHIQVEVTEESGYESALRGFAYSFRDREVPMDEWWTKEKRNRAIVTTKKHASLDGGRNKFLESMTVHIDVEAPRYWWQEMDTYRAGTSKQSESTMHTITRRDLIKEDFEFVTDVQLNFINSILDTYRKLTDPEDKKRQMVFFKAVLPEGFLQRRMICTNYKTLRNIILQRRNHMLPHWKEFISSVLCGVEHPEYLPGLEAEF